MAERKSKEYKLSLNETVWLEKERVAGFFDRYFKNYIKRGDEWELESVTFRRVSLQRETYDPGKTSILIPYLVRGVESSDRFIGIEELSNKGKACELSKYAISRDKPFPYFYKGDQRRNLHFYPQKQPVTQDLLIPEKLAPNFARELCNRPVTEKGSDDFSYSTALTLEANGIAGFRVDYGNNQKALHSTRNLTCLIRNSVRDVVIICGLDSNGQLSGHIYQEPEVHQYITINRDIHPAVLEAERVLSQR